MPYGRFLTPNMPTTGEYVRRFYVIPAELLYLVSGAIQELSIEENWEQFGDMSPHEVASLFTSILDTPADESV